MSYEEFKQVYCYELPKVQFDTYEKIFEMEFCHKEMVMEYPLENRKMKQDKFKFIHNQVQKSMDIPARPQVKNFDKEFMEFLIEWMSSLNKKGALK